MLSALDLARRIEAGELDAAPPSSNFAPRRSPRARPRSAPSSRSTSTARADARRGRASSRAKPLRGLPVGVKDIFDTADMPTEYGSPIYAGHRPKADAALVALIRRAGGIMLGKTVTTEFAHLDPGKTRNPHNLDAHAGRLVVGLGRGASPPAWCRSRSARQTGGSVIRPASYCGVAGFKPSYRLLPTVGMKCFSWHLDTAGLFAAGVADVAFAAAAITGRDLRVDRATPAAPRIALLRTHAWAEASEAMQAAVETAARAAEGGRRAVSEIELPPIFADAFRAHATIQDYEAYRALAFEYDRHRDRLGPCLRELLERAAAITADAYDDARRTASRARQALADLMADIDVILTPSAPGAAPKGLGSTGPSTFNRLWTLMGAPCVNVPGLVDAARTAARRAGRRPLRPRPRRARGGAVRRARRSTSDKGR